MIRMTAALATVFLAASAYAADTAPGKPFIYTPKASDVVVGKADAPVTIVEYASLSCPHCGHFFNKVLPEINTKYIDTGKAKLVYRDYPLNRPALVAAEMVQCADKDRRHAFIKVLFSTQNKWALDANYKESLAGIAALGGMDRAKFNACVNNKDVEKTILENVKEATDLYKINSTPTFFINGRMESGDVGVDEISAAVDSALKLKEFSTPKTAPVKADEEKK